MVRLLEIQAKLREELTIAIETHDSASLDKLILKAEKLEMGSDEIVLTAKEVSSFFIFNIFEGCV